VVYSRELAGDASGRTVVVKYFRTPG